MRSKVSATQEALSLFREADSDVDPAADTMKGKSKQLVHGERRSLGAGGWPLEKRTEPTSSIDNLSSSC